MIVDCLYDHFATISQQFAILFDMWFHNPSVSIDSASHTDKADGNHSAPYGNAHTLVRTPLPDVHANQELKKHTVTNPCFEGNTTYNNKHDLMDNDNS